jgi:hypothetical protein
MPSAPSIDQSRSWRIEQKGAWIWPEDIRRDADLADRFWEKIDRETRIRAGR